MEQGYDMGTMQGIAVYAMLLFYILLGGISFWFGYRFFGTALIVASAAALVWFAAGGADASTMTSLARLISVHSSPLASPKWRKRAGKVGSTHWRDAARKFTAEGFRDRRGKRGSSLLSRSFG